ncbi:MAG: hypothetical protein WA715_09605 [Candidatus Acidiferrum sp.]|jgi:hypothetical protein
MKRMRRSILCFVALFVWAPMLDAQTADLSKYRDFSIGTSVTVVLSGTGQKPDEVTAISNRPGLIQQLTWWPGTLPGTPMHKDAVEHIVFNFFNNALYKISVTYERKATEGLTPDDMIESLSAKYGSPANVTPQTVQNPNDRYAARREPVASWEDAQYSFSLVRSTFSDDFELVVISKRLNAEAETATAEAAKLDEQERPQKDAERQKKETTDLELARQKNQKSFRP